MMNSRIIIFYFISIFCVCSIFSQQGVVDIMDLKSVKDSIFFAVSIDSNDSVLLKYSIDKGPLLDLDNKMNFDHKGDIGTYITWLNPLDVEVTTDLQFKDDQLDVMVNQFFVLLTNQFKVTKKVGTESINEVANLSEVYRMGRDVDSMPKPEFSDQRLLLWYLQVLQTYTSATDKVKGTIYENFSKLISALNELEKGLSFDVKGKFKKVFDDLRETSDPNELRKDTGKFHGENSLLRQIKNANDNLNKYVNSFKKEYPNRINWDEDNNSELTTLKLFSETTLSTYIKKVESELTSRAVTISVLEELVRTLENSAESVITTKKKYFVPLKPIERKRGKINELKLTLKKKIYNEEKFKLEETKELANLEIIFHPYRFLIPTISTGVFYSQLRIVSFEAGIDEVGDTIVESVESGDEPIFSTMLNFYLNAPLWDVLPLFQLGIDPTKERPFLLLGTGIGFPGSNLAFSFGAAWTWQQSLKTLEINGPAESAAQIKDDIEYTFENKPKVYFGIQYNF